MTKRPSHSPRQSREVAAFRYLSEIERAGVLKGDGPRGPVRSHLIKLGWIEIDGVGVRLTVKGKLALAVERNT
jgi:hypothetical protein